MIKKIDLLRRYYKEGNYHKALEIASKFWTGLTKEELNILRKAYECGSPMTQGFYKSLGVDMKKSVDEGIKLLEKKYIKKDKKVKSRKSKPPKLLE